MTLQNVTVIIPAHNRPERLRRLLDYYSRTDIKVLVPDSSDHPFADAEKYPDITYLHRPKLHFLLKLKEVLPMISTPYVLYCADDDFAVPSGIAQMTAFLDEHPDYSTAQGHYLTFTRFCRFTGRYTAENRRKLFLPKRYKHKKGGRRPDCLERKHHMAFPEKETGGGISQLGGYTQPAEKLFSRHNG